MIECSSENIYYKKRRVKKSRRLFPLILILIILTGGVVYYKTVVENFIGDICESYLQSYSAEAVNEAVMNLLKDVKYTDLVEVEKNDGGDVVLISTNSYAASYLNREIAVEVQKSLQKKLDEGIPVPFLAFTGIKFISGYGFTVNLKNVNTSGVVCEFEDAFTSAGINQTLHSLYLKVNATASFNIPLDKKTARSETYVLLTESVIIGKVPEILFER